MSIPWSPAGGNIQVGWCLDRLFFAADFGAGVASDEYLDGSNYSVRIDTTTYNFYCGSLSFGGRIQPNASFQVILGATFGIHAKFEEKNNYSYDRHYDEYYYYSYDYYTLERKFVLAQGPMVKFLFGTKNLWFEIANDFVFGYSYAAFNVKAGLTYAPTRK
jgi:hypothetical protein